MRIPVRGLQERDKDRSPAKNRMEGYAFNEAMKGPCSALCKVGTKPVAPHIFHLVFVWERWDGACWIFSKQGFVQVKEISKSTAESKVGFLERFEVGLFEWSEVCLMGRAGKEEPTWVVTR